MTAQASVSKPTKSAQRDERGRFLPGTAAGPGRPPSTTPITDLLRAEAAKRPDLVSELFEKARDDWRCAAWIIDHLEPTQKDALNVNVNVGVALVWSDGAQA